MEPGQSNGDTADLAAFAARLGVDFRDLTLLRRALTHRSFFNEHPEMLADNERLEFLGDAVLDFLVASWLYHHFPEMAEGQLTRLRSALVGNAQLGEFARQLGVGEVLLLGKGEAVGGGRKRGALLGSTFEALVGALYLDQDIETVARFIEPLLQQAAPHILAGRTEIDAKSLLQEWAQAQKLGTPTYRTVEARGPDHAKIFTVEVEINGQVRACGEGNSKQSAAKDAARQALIGLDIA
jgi:ribonuclease-3